MKNYNIQPHTADIRLHIEASSRQELFEAALEGLNSLLYDQFLEKNNGKMKNIELEAPDGTSLLVDFLSEVLTLSFIFQSICVVETFESLTLTTLKASLIWYPIETFSDDIKAVTYHEANIIETQNGACSATIILDI